MEKELWKIVGTSTLTSAVLLILFGAFIKHRLAIEMELFKKSINQKMLEHQIRFSKLHERRAEILGELYSRIVEFYRAVSDLLSPIQMSGELSKEEQLPIVNEKIEAFMTFFRKHRIYLPAELCQQIETVYSQIQGSGREYAMYISIPPDEDDKDDLEKKMAAWRDGWKQITDQVPDALKGLEAEFRMLLDVSTEENK